MTTQSFTRPPIWAVAVTVLGLLALVYIDSRDGKNTELPPVPAAARATAPERYLPERYKLPARPTVGQPLTVPLAP
jgi:hypothetical protein